MTNYHYILIDLARRLCQVALGAAVEASPRPRIAIVEAHEGGDILLTVSAWADGAFLVEWHQAQRPVTPDGATDLDLAFHAASELAAKVHIEITGEPLDDEARAALVHEFKLSLPRLRRHNPSPAAA